MLIIRKEQMEAFDQAQLKSFEDRMVLHLQKYFPEETRLMPESRLRQRIQQEIARAEKYGIVDEVEVATYISTIFVLNPMDRKTPDLEWVQEILSAPNYSPSEKVQRLRFQAETILKKQEDNDAEAATKT